ncbi:MAG: hypothetical protein LZF60_370035 [Nitrospira sp.]|nr:MAG: hypothetical protein LZF60_370035 [Nitrospira sp.]
MPRFRVYDLSHTYASLLLSARVPLLYVAQQLGHTKPHDDAEILCAMDSEWAGSRCQCPRP